MLTELETQILNTASLLPEPIVPELISKTLRKTHRGIKNALGRLVKKEILCCDRITGYYYFHKQTVKLQHLESLGPEDRQSCFIAIVRAWKNSDFHLKGQLFHKINVHLAFDTMQSDADQHLMNGIFDSIRYLNQDDINWFVSFADRLVKKEHKEKVLDLIAR